MPHSFGNLPSAPAASPLPAAPPLPRPRSSTRPGAPPAPGSAGFRHRAARVPCPPLHPRRAPAKPPAKEASQFDRLEFDPGGVEDTQPECRRKVDVAGLADVVIGIRVAIILPHMGH